jgi:hypothetical protein
MGAMLAGIGRPVKVSVTVPHSIIWQAVVRCSDPAVRLNPSGTGDIVVIRRQPFSDGRQGRSQRAWSAGMALRNCTGSRVRWRILRFSISTPHEKAMAK